MTNDGMASGVAMRIILDVTSEGGTLAGTLTTDEGTRTFWGWLELMNALELATGSPPGNGMPSRMRGDER